MAADGNGEDFLLKLLDQHPTGELDVLDAGCGHGELTLALARRARSVVGVDRRAKLLELAGELLAESGLANVRFIQAALAGPRDPRPGGPLPLPHSSVDLVAEQRGPPLVRYVADLARQLARPRAIIIGTHPAGTARPPPWAASTPSLRERFLMLGYDGLDGAPAVTRCGAARTFSWCQVGTGGVRESNPVLARNPAGG